jgi:hypothetical protein
MDGLSDCGALDCRAALAARQPLGRPRRQLSPSFRPTPSAVELCLFDGGGCACCRLRECTDEVWHGYLAGAAPGLRYAYRVHGPAHGTTQDGAIVSTAGDCCSIPTRAKSSAASRGRRTMTRCIC